MEQTPPNQRKARRLARETTPPREPLRSFFQHSCKTADRPAYAVIVADAAVTAIVVSGALGRDVSWEDVARVWFYDIIWFVLTDLCKIPLTMSIENLFPPVPVTEAPVPDESDHVLAFGCVDLGYAYVRDTKENVRRAVVAAVERRRRGAERRGGGGGRVGMLYRLFTVWRVDGVLVRASGL